MPPYSIWPGDPTHVTHYTGKGGYQYFLPIMILYILCAWLGLVPELTVEGVEGNVFMGHVGGWGGGRGASA